MTKEFLSLVQNNKKRFSIYASIIAAFICIISYGANNSLYIVKMLSYVSFGTMIGYAAYMGYYNYNNNTSLEGMFKNLNFYFICILSVFSFGISFILDGYKFSTILFLFNLIFFSLRFYFLAIKVSKQEKKELLTN